MFKTEELIRQYITLNHCPKADRINIYKNLVEQSEENPDLESFFCGMILFLQNRYEEAIDIFKQVINISITIYLRRIS